MATVYKRRTLEEAPETHAIDKVQEKTELQKFDTHATKWIVTVVGVLLCCTVVGMIIGLPMIIAAWCYSDIDLQPDHLLEAPCPFCNTLLHVPASALGENCPACQKRFIVREGHFVGID